jgi:molybdate transport system regulatory protein
MRGLGSDSGVDQGRGHGRGEGRLEGGDQELTSSITRDAADELDLKQGSAVTVLIKSTEMALGVE